ncbi:MAG: 50S ribosomal protein L25, partial [Victivallales bacterium]|nr:50S ribosomal protein L25 [Victivallales bacterium]
NARRIRRAGQVPAVVYGHGQPAIAITVSPEDADKATAHSGLIEINCSCGEAKKLAVVKEVQRHPINPGILHIDFQEVKMDEMINSVVPVILEGEAAGTKQGGQLEEVLMEIEVKSLPTNMPEEIVVNVAELELNQAIHVKDLVLPEGVTAVTDESLIVCHVRAPKAEAVEETAAAPAEGEDAAAAPADKEK